jgi:hypothetical protein
MDARLRLFFFQTTVPHFWLAIAIRSHSITSQSSPDYHTNLDGGVYAFKDYGSFMVVALFLLAIETAQWIFQLESCCQIAEVKLDRTEYRVGLAS